MYDMTVELADFYARHVRLGQDLRNDLAAKRDLNLKRVNGGLDKLAEETGRSHPHWSDWQNQGGYAMHTLNQDPADERDYDIDVAVIFRKEDLPSGALDARKRVCEALKKSGANFSKEPEARTNAVTIYYADGYHIDFAVFRTYDENGKRKIEHASTEWKARDPAEVTNWFTKKVDELSPKENAVLGYKPQVSPGQLRRVVRFVKWFCRSRPSWSLPGGMIVSALVANAEVYRPSGARDDRALYDTLVALRDQLNISCKVYNPVDGSELTARTELLNQVERLRDRLKDNLPKLDVLFRQDCTRAQARSAWDWIFSHDYWAKKGDVQKSLADASGRGMPYAVDVTCEVTDHENGPVRRTYRSGQGLLPKNMSLRFTARTDAPADSYIEWICKNDGDEAVADKCLGWTKTGRQIWTSTRYKGAHTLTCRVSRGGRIVAEKVFLVRIARGPIEEIRARRQLT